MTNADDAAALAQWNRNKYSLYADLGIGALFFILVKLTDDLPLSALITAGAGLGLVVVQRFVSVDLLGGLAMFGVVVLLLSAGVLVRLRQRLGGQAQEHLPRPADRRADVR
jgi:ABC-type uncharacterized transport system permease subunit